MRKMRIPPSGPYMGTPPVRVGPNTMSVKFRQHGVATSAHYIGTTTTQIAGISDLGGPYNVDMQPGYLYDLELHYAVRGVTLTVGAQFTAWYRLRAASTGVYGSWIAMSWTDHTISGTTLYTSPEACIADAVIATSVTTPVDRIEFGLVGDAAAAAVRILDEHAWAYVQEFIVDV